MKKLFQIFTKVFGREDYFYSLLIIGSFIIAFITEDSSWQLILICVGILSLVALISSVAQKFTEFYENIPRSAFTSEANYTVTTQSTEMGTQQTIENFDSEDDFTELSNKEDSEEEKLAPPVQTLTGRSFDEEYSGVRIIGRKKLQMPTQDDSGLREEQFPQTFKTFNVDLEKDNAENPSEYSEEIPTKTQSDSLFGNSESVTSDSTQEKLFQTDIQDIHSVVSEQDIISKEIPKNSFFEIHPLFGDEPKKELEYFISKIMMLIKATVNVNTLGLFMYDVNNNSVRLYSYLTENEQYINPQTNFELGTDIISYIKKNGKPEILAPINIASVTDILPYYKDVIEIISFAGIPVFQNNQVIGVLTLDSFEQHTFDSNVIKYIGNLTKLMSSLFTSLNEKFDLMTSAKTLEAINNFRSMLRKDDITFDTILSSAFKTIKDILGFENIAFCNYSSPNNTWKVQALQGNQNFADKITNATIVPNKSLISKTLFKKELLFLAPIGDNKNIIKSDEDFNPDGYFASVPLKSLNSSYGAIFVYGDNYQNISNNDLHILNILAEQIASTIEKYLYINVFQSYSHKDPYTGIYNPGAFFQRLEEELSRSHDFNSDLSFLAIKIDDYEMLHYTKGLEESVQKLIVELIKSKLRKYDLIGHIDEKIVGLILLNMKKEEVRIWADQIRHEIASKILTFDNLRMIVTVSIGIVAVEQGDTVDNLASKSLEMLNKACSKKNSICVY